jgi:hypothetical protein
MDDSGWCCHQLVSYDLGALHSKTVMAVACWGGRTHARRKLASHVRLRVDEIELSNVRTPHLGMTGSSPSRAGSLAPDGKGVQSLP